MLFIGCYLRLNNENSCIGYPNRVQFKVSKLRVAKPYLTPKGCRLLLTKLTYSSNGLLMIFSIAF